ncbi:TetR/AcrR family transcriptional regulator [Cellulomonas phragmiteti]|uniref:TetR family transcriptional regulator n=1 Tax=Cellulomonas phragmiteti TaxID=478780 RepID=A0ABQ4DJQ1_9CELL|nr:TetR family transcriptional regulator [Cellulomonas phragmiteti]GIG39156.1 TetR family transcriptional regulator [Cellulomonas phragmiteti]
MPAPPERPRPTGRRPGDSGTRDAILDAALALFAERGYDGASLRAIAAAAGVDPGLIRHFFGDKEALFATAVADRMQVAHLLARAASADPTTAGRAMTEAYLGLWEGPDTGPIVRALVRSATTSESAARMMREMIGPRIHDATGGDTALAGRIALAASNLLGVAMARYVIGVGPVVDLPRDELVDRLAPVVQHYLTGA